MLSEASSAGSQDHLDSVVGGEICCVWVSCCRCKRVPSRCPPLRVEHLSVGLEPDRAPGREGS
jgi:hypothetical protein